MSEFTIQNDIIMQYCGDGGDVVIPNGATAIYDYAFSDCTNVCGVVVPKSITYIGYGAFCGCTALRYVVLPVSLKRVCEWAFGNGNTYSDKAVDIYYCGSMADYEKMMVEGDYYCTDCCPRFVWCFYSEESPKQKGNFWHYENGQPTKWANCDNQSAVTFVSRLALRSKALQSDEAVQSATKSVQATAQDIVDCTNRTSSANDSDLNTVVTRSKDADTNQKNMSAVADKEVAEKSENDSAEQKNVSSELNDKGVSANNCATPPAETAQENSAYSDSAEGSFSEATTIGDSPVTANCKEEDFVVDNTVLVKYKGSSANIVIPSNVTVIKQYAFLGCGTIESLVVPKNVKIIENYAFEYCSNLKSVVMEEGVEHIGWCAFDACKNLSNVSFPKSVTNVYASSFANTLFLEQELTRQGGVCYVNDILLKASVSGHYVVKDGTKIIGGGAFEGCGDLVSVEIPASVTKVLGRAFMRCKNLTHIIAPQKLCCPEGMTFRECESLREVALAEGISAIGDGYFMECKSLTCVEIPDGVECINIAAFDSCKSMEYIVVPKSLRTVNTTAFPKCSSLSMLYYKGTAEEFKKISVNQLSNQKFKLAKRYFYSETKPVEQGNFWHYVNGLPEKWQ